MQTLFSDWLWGPMSIQNVVSVKTKIHPRVYQGKGNTHSYQLGIKFTGRSELCYQGFHIDFRPRTVVYLPKEASEEIDYTTVTEEIGNGVCIFFDSQLPLPSEPQMLTGVDSGIEAAFLKVLHCYQHYEPSRYPTLMAEFYALLAGLSDMREISSEDAEKKRFSVALAYMEKHSKDGYIDLKHMADLCGMSEKYFRDSFQRVFKISPLQYFHRRKTIDIRVLISDLSLSVAEVSLRSGFSDPNYFSRFFKKHFGVSPTEYRNYYCKLS